MFVTGLMVPALLQAHAKLEKTQPADGTTVSVSPPQIQLSFDEEVDLKVSKIEMTGPSGSGAFVARREARRRAGRRASGGWNDQAKHERR